MQLSQTFYDRLEQEGWESDEVNGCDILQIRNDFDVDCEIWPVEDSPDALEFTFHTYEKRGRFQFRIEHQQQDDFIINRILDCYNAESYVALIDALLQNPKLAVYVLKFFQHEKGGETLVSQQRVTAENLPMLDAPQFEPIDWIDFYLAGKVSSTLTIPNVHFDAAYQRLAARYELQFGSLQETIANLFYYAPPLDAEGNIIDIPFGGDIWDFEFLDVLKDLFVPNSFIELQDDGNVYWKVVVHPQKIEYFRERLSP